MSNMSDNNARDVISRVSKLFRVYCVACEVDVQQRPLLVVMSTAPFSRRH